MIALPKHSPCGLDGSGEVDPATGHVTCTTIRTFRRCGCERRPEAPTRGDPRCEGCRGIGATVVGTKRGCGAISMLCPRCGLRARWNGGYCSACERDPGTEAAPKSG